MSNANADIRKEAKTAKVAHWKIAKHLGCAESTFCRKLRDELSPKEKADVREAIKELSMAERGGGDDGNICEAFGA
ncbi:MAG: hypothetical protein ACOYKD_10445 [Anaerolineaceae bacterium]|jgi:hypothetical protein